MDGWAGTPSKPKRRWRDSRTARTLIVLAGLPLVVLGFVLFVGTYEERGAYRTAPVCGTPAPGPDADCLLLESGQVTGNDDERLPGQHVPQLGEGLGIGQTVSPDDDVTRLRLIERRALPVFAAGAEELELHGGLPRVRRRTRMQPEGQHTGPFGKTSRPRSEPRRHVMVVAVAAR
ncbi:hypothetical protein ACGF13_38215 [Kitasatospora sp. NPDC048286]|uniref:hypothetical protein n=1 Tax=Kitasatospora sp. NPDC048286 TaxID=3364047 RepID=UPI003714053E